MTLAPATALMGAPVSAAPVAAAPAANDAARHPGAVTSPIVGTAYLAPEPGKPNFVAVGDKVTAGQTLGVLGTEPGHCAPVTCLHWGLRAGAEYLDPLTLLGAREVRLLPVGPPETQARG